MGVPGTVPNPNAGEFGRELADAQRSQHHQRETAEQGQGTQGDDERGQAHPGDEDAVEHAADDSHAEHYGDSDPERDSSGPEIAKDGTGQPDHRLDRQVDLTQDDDQGHGQRHDAHLDERGDEVGEVAARQEVR